MADGSGKLKGLREQMVAAAQALAEERRSQSGSSPVTVPSAVSTKTTKPVIDGSALRTDERQRLARERREEREKLNAAKESQLIEKEKKAKLQYEKQMEEKQRKLEEQKQKDEQKRAAAEEKRKQKLTEEKERREANVRRTLERSSHLDHRQKRWSWGGSVDGDKPANKLSSSATNLKNADSAIHKRLSSSSATLQNSSDKGVKQRSSSLSRLSNRSSNLQSLSSRVSSLEKKGTANQKRSSSLNRLNNKPSLHLEGVKKEDLTVHRPQSSPLDSNIINRLLAPTQSSLARSKSAATLSAEGKDSPESHLCPRSASATSISTPPSVSKGPMRSRSIDRLKLPQSTSAVGSPQSIQKEPEKPTSVPLAKRPPSPTASSRRRSPSPVLTPKRAPSPTLESKKIPRNRPQSPSAAKQRPPSPTVTHKPIPIQRLSLTPSVLSTTKKSTEPEAIPKEKLPEVTASEPKTLQTLEKDSTPAPKTKDEPIKTTSGSSTAEEAAKNLAEKRRLAREQREREEQERIQRQKEEEIRQEEMARKAEEDRIRQKEEAEQLKIQQELQREEDEQKEQEERIRREHEEQERQAELQQQREEAEAKALEEAEKQRQERDKIMQQNKQERLERKRRIDEIMKRTRKTDQLDFKLSDRADLGAEDDELNSLESNQHEGLNGVDSGEDTDDQDDTESEVTTPVPSLTDDSAHKEREFFFIGETSVTDQKVNGLTLEAKATEDSSLVTNGTTHENLISPFNEDNETTELVHSLNGKSSTWTFEEIIDLGIHSKTSLSSDSITAETCDQALIEAAMIPTPKLAFEDEHVNSLSKVIDSAAEM